MGRLVDTVALSETLPEMVLAVLNDFLTAELTTLGKGERPVTWPIMPMFWAERGLLVAFTSIGLPQKALNVRRDPRVSLLFSEPIGSDLNAPPAVLVQGTARAPETVIASSKDADPALWAVMERMARKMIRRQPTTGLYLSNGLMRALMDWYFMRLAIIVAPARIMWWPRGDFSARREMVEVTHVGEDQAVSARV